MDLTREYTVIWFIVLMRKNREIEREWRIIWIESREWTDHSWRYEHQMSHH